MFQYRQVLVRLRAGDSAREAARCGLMGRDKLGELRPVAQQHDLLDPASEVPDDAAIVAALGQGRRVASSTISSVEPHRGWHVVQGGDGQGIGALKFMCAGDKHKTGGHARPSWRKPLTSSSVDLNSS
jgi:hypothetical protein